MIKIITIYDAKEIDFKHNGLAILTDVMRCEIEEELNGFYGLELEYPMFDKKVEYLIEDNIIKVPTPNGHQLFRIYRKIKTMSTITIYGKHIFYDLLDNFIESYRTGSVNANVALQGILNNTQYPHDFKGNSNINDKTDAFYVRKNPAEAIIGDNENSFLSRWGGEILRDNFNISILRSIGKDNGVSIAYGKNLIGIEEDLNKEDVVTRIMPTGLTENDSIVILKEKYIDSPNINKYPFPKIRHLHFGDIKVDPEKNISIEDVKKMLREKVQELYQIQHIDIPKANYKVDFAELSNTEEYKNYSCLEKVNLGDIVTVKHKKMGIDIRQKVIKYKWDSLLEKYLEIELGSFKENLSTDLSNLSNSIDEVKESLENTKKQFASKIEQQDDRITLTVEEIGKCNSKIEETANSITLEVNDKIKDCNSKIEQTEESITSSVNNKISNCNSNIEQSANNITSTVSRNFQDVNRKIRDCNSSITQNANNISLVVRGGEIDGNALVSSINMSDKKIKMRALNIDLDGYVTFRNLERGETTIDGGCIDCSNIDTDEIGSRITHVSKFIHFNGHNGLGGIGLNRDNDLWLYSNGDVVVDAIRMKFKNGDRVATREWVKDFVDERLEKFKEILDFLKK